MMLSWVLGTVAAVSTAAEDSKFFVGTCGGDVPLFSLKQSSVNNTAVGNVGGSVSLTNMKQFFLGGNPGWTIPHPTKSWLYAADVTHVTALKYTVGPTGVTGKVMSNITGFGNAGVHMSMTDTANHLVMVGYISGTVASVGVNTDGSLDKVVSVSNHSGTSGCDPSTPSGGRQKSPHPHSIVKGPMKGSKGESWYYSPDLGLDKVFQYAVDDVSGALTIVSTTDVATCSGPRHMAFHPDGTHAYLLHEMASSITLHAVSKADGSLSKALSTLPLVPAPDTEHWSYCQTVAINGAGNCTKAAEVRITPDGKYLYASNRGHNSVVVLSLSPAGDAFVGDAKLAADVIWVRGMNISPDGEYLVMASDGNNDMALDLDATAAAGTANVGVGTPANGQVIVYGINHKDGSLQSMATSPVPTGCDITFVPKY